MATTNDPNEQDVTYLPADASRPREGVAARYRLRQQARQRMPIVQKPPRAPADQGGWWGGKKESPAAQRHNRQLDTVEHAAVEAGYAIQCGVQLEYVAVRDSARALEGMVDTLMGLAPQSLEFSITEQLLFDGGDRIRALNADATEQFRRRVFGS